jgi:hypothetical protein
MRGRVLDRITNREQCLALTEKQFLLAVAAFVNEELDAKSPSNEREDAIGETTKHCTNSRHSCLRHRNSGDFACVAMA